MCDNFCCTTKWFTHPKLYINIHSFSDSFPIQIITEYWVELSVLYSTSSLANPSTYTVCLCQTLTLSPSLPLLAPVPFVSKVCESVSVLQIRSFVSFFYSPRIFVFHCLTSLSMTISRSIMLPTYGIMSFFFNLNFFGKEYFGYIL